MTVLLRLDQGRTCEAQKIYEALKRLIPSNDYKEEYTTIEEAYQRERQLHGWSRKKKEALISGDVDAKNLSRAKSREE